MNVAGLIIAIIIGLVLGLLVGFKGQTKHIEIRFKVLYLEWIFPTTSLFLFFIIGFIIEIVLSMFLSGVIRASCKMLETTDPVLRIIGLMLDLVGLLIDNGLFVLLLSVFVFKGYGKSVESFNLDYLEDYNQNVPKVCFSTIVLMVCIVLFFNIDYFGFGHTTKGYVLNRIAIWILYVAGLWVVIDNVCKGRLWKEKDNAEKAKRKKAHLIDKDFRTKHRLWFIIIISFVICTLILIWSMYLHNSKLNSYIVVLIAVYMVSSVITLYFVQRKTNPSEKQSKKKFIKAKQYYMNTGKRVESRFGLMSYVVEDNVLTVQAVDISYEGHDKDEEFKKLFDGRIYVVAEDTDWNDAFEKLIDRYNKQKEYIRKGYEACTEEKRREKKESI